MSSQEIFKEAVWSHYASSGRDLPWRVPGPDGSFDPYHILVSELMLQQTQVRRVIPKYHQFLQVFPTITSLADATLGEVIKQWQGLGYNRRAKFLHASAQKIVSDFGGIVPSVPEQLESLPGVGRNTAAAICVYAYNQSLSFIETNIRSVYIHHFFNDHALVDDKDILDLVIKTVDHENPREWYWALMDYGSFLKTHVGNASRQSKSYTKQSKFEGSKRQIRGQVLRSLSDKSASFSSLRQTIQDERLKDVLHDLQAEGFIKLRNNVYSLK